jgi:hypothetical protein
MTAPELAYLVRHRGGEKIVAEKRLTTQERRDVGDFVFSPTRSDGSSESNGNHIWKVTSVEDGKDRRCDGILNVEYVQPHPEHRHHWDDARDQDGSRKQRCACGAVQVRPGLIAGLIGLWVLSRSARKEASSEGDDTEPSIHE